MESSIGRIITYESISPSVLQYLEIRKLFITDASGNCLIKADKLRISFSLYKYFFTEDFPIGSVYFENSAFTYNHQKDASLIKAASESLGSSKKGNRKLKNLEIHGRNISVFSDMKTGQFKLQKLFLNIGFSEEEISFNMRAKASGSSFLLFDKKRNFQTELKMMGNTASDYSWYNFDTELVNFRSDEILLKKQNFNFNYSKGIVKIQKTKARDPFDLYAEYDTINRTVSLNGKAENYVPSKYVNYFSRDKTVSGLLKSAYSGTAVLVLKLDENTYNSLSYSSSLSISFHNSLIPFRNSIKTDFTGDSDHIAFSNFKAETEKGDITYTGIYDIRKNLPEGRITLKNLKAGKDIIISSDTMIKIKDSNSLILISDTKTGNLDFKNIECFLSRKNKSISYNISLVNKEKGFISAEGSLNYSSELLLVSDVNISNFEINQLSAVKGNEKDNSYFFPDNTYLNSRFYAETDFKSLNLFTYNFSLNDKTGKNRISSDFTASGGNYVFYNIIIDWESYNGKGHINIEDAEDRYLINSDIFLNNESYSFKGDYIQGSSLTLTGSRSFNLSVFFDKNRTVYYLNTERFPFPMYSSVPEFSFNIKGETGNRGVNFQINNNRIYNLPFLKGDSSFISFSSEISETKAAVHSFAVKDNFSELNGSGDFNISRNSISGWLRAGSNDLKEEHLIMLDYSSGIYELTAEFMNFPSERITNKSLSGDLTGTFYFKGTKTNPYYSIDMAMNSGTLLDDPFSFDLSLNASSGSMILNSLKMRYNLNRIDSASGFISRDDGNYTFTGNLFLRKGISDKGSENKINLEGQIFENSFKWFSNPFFIENKGILKVDNRSAEKDDFSSWELAYINNENFLIFNGGPGNSIEGEISRKGIFDILLTKPLPVSGNFKGEIKKGIIDSSFENIKLDMKTFGSLTDIAYFKAVSGTAAGNLKLNGPVNDPDFNGHLNVSGVKASSVFVPVQVILPNTSFIFNGKSLTMPETLVNAEENRIRVNLDFSIDHWVPREFKINIATEPGNMLWIKHNFAMVDIDGFASGNIIIEGDEQGLLLSGDVVAKKCIITLSDENKEEKPKKRSSFDYEIELKITSGPGVEFYWPSVRFPVLRTFASAGEKLTIYSNTASDEYSLNGDIKIQGGEVFYFSQSFFVKEGIIVFNENETKFDPHLTARAELRERTSDSREVKISLIAEDTPLSRFSPRFESNPPLSENEIYALLGESVYTQFGGENISFGSALLGAGAYSTQLIGIFRPFETRMKDLLNLDLFTIRTNVLQHAIGSEVNDDVTLSEDNTPVSNPSLDNTTIFMGKYFGEYFFLEGLLSFNTRDFDIYQDNDYDVPDFMGMYMKSELSLEVDTPLFLMDLTLYPRIKDFYDSLADTSLEFSWSFSY